METTVAWLEKVYEHVQDDYDMMIPVVGDEGKGKSTYMNQLGWLWRGITDREQTPEAVVHRQTAWDLDEFQHALSEREQHSCIIVHDAARVLSRKKAMHGDQIEVEEDLLDARFGNHVVFLGYQEFDIIPTMLATRRSKQLLRIPSRGIVHGHKESGIRKRYNSDKAKWPDPAMRDTFPDLEGTDLWKEFKREDARRKRQRIAPDEEEQEEEFDPHDVVEQVREDGFDKVVSIHGGHNKPYFDPDLIQVEYGLSGSEAKTVKKLLSRDHDPSRARI